MIELTHDTPMHRMIKLKVGDEVVDTYETSGKIINIAKNEKSDFTEFLLTLDNMQKIFLMIS